MTRRRGINRQLTWAICSAVAAAVVLAGLIALGLIRHSYDGQARATLHREAALVAELASRPATVSATRPGRPAAQLLVGTGVQLVRVRATGRIAFGSFALDPVDVGAAQAGQTVSATRTIGGSRYLVEVAPVTGDGGVVLAQKTSAASSVTRQVLRRFLGALAIGLVFAALFGAWLARRISRPLVDAASAAHRLAAGDRDVRLQPDGPTEVADVADSLNTLAAALATSEGRQRQFLLSISHELRTPLTAIRGFAEAIADEVAVGEDATAAGETIVAESQRLQRLVSDLLDLARLGADDFRLDVTTVDLQSPADRRRCRVVSQVRSRRRDLLHRAADRAGRRADRPDPHPPGSRRTRRERPAGDACRGADRAVARTVRRGRPGWPAGCCGDRRTRWGSRSHRGRSRGGVRQICPVRALPRRPPGRDRRRAGLGRRPRRPARRHGDRGSRTRRRRCFYGTAADLSLRRQLRVPSAPSRIDCPSGRGRWAERPHIGCAPRRRWASVSTIVTRSAGGETHERSIHRGCSPAVHDRATELVATGSAHQAIRERRLP